MKQGDKPIRVLYSFPHKIGAERICYTAWEQVNGLSAAGADVLVFPGVLHRPLPTGVRVTPTLAWGKFRISYKLVGMMRACALHDYIVSQRLEKLAGKIDIVHTWSLGALRTLKTAARLGIPTVLERPNAHTRFAYEVVRKECDRIGVPLPPGHEHEYNAAILAKEEAEYLLADGLLCPSDFVVKTFRDQGFPSEKLFRHIYGFDEKRFFPDPAPRDPKRGLTMISVGVCAVRKGLHFALEAWLKSPASRDGTFLIAGEFIPGYAEKLAPMLSHPSVKVLGHRKDVPELMRKSDILVLPSIEE
jgi:glycosyltransferase involved in cell wall biosynthesis